MLIFALAYCGRNFSFVFWENWKNPKALSKLTDFYALYANNCGHFQKKILRSMSKNCTIERFSLDPFQKCRLMLESNEWILQLSFPQVTETSC